MVDTINQKRVLIVEFKGIRQHSVREFASGIDKALQKCYSMVLMYKRSMSETHSWLGFQPSPLRLVDLECDFLLTATLNRLPFEKSRCKPRFIGTNPDARVNVYRYLTNNGILNYHFLSSKNND